MPRGESRRAGASGSHWAKTHPRLTKTENRRGRPSGLKYATTLLTLASKGRHETTHEHLAPWQQGAQVAGTVNASPATCHHHNNKGSNMNITQRLRMRHGLRWATKNPPLGRAFHATWQLILGLALLLLAHAWMVERDIADAERRDAERHQATATQAMKALQDCLNGNAIRLGDDSGKVISAIFCEASKEIRI